MSKKTRVCRVWHSLDHGRYWCYLREMKSTEILNRRMEGSKVSIGKDILTAGEKAMEPDSGTRDLWYSRFEIVGC